MSSMPNQDTDLNNEKIIDELTADLETKLVQREDSLETCSEGSNEDFAECEDDKGHPDFNLNSEKADKPKPEEDNSEEDNDDESELELRLKDEEITLSEEDKQIRKNEALEYKIKGNDSFKVGEYIHSKEYYSQALAICPLCYPIDRAILYSNRAAANQKLEENKLAIKDCTKAIENDPNYTKAYFRRAVCYEQTEKLDESLADFNKVLELDPQHQDAKKATVRLPPLIEERNEKLKTEMMGKLKDLGNLFLRPFGMSTDNFQMIQDPVTKGYSINFKK